MWDGAHIQKKFDKMHMSRKLAHIQKNLIRCTCHVSLLVLIDALMVMPLGFY